jgi:surfactin synthase thioesterase subunit
MSQAGRLYCFPHAGGSGALYSRWRRRYRWEQEVVPVEPPGRGRRWRETPPASFEDVVDDATRTIAAAPAGPFALFGHSIGALTAFETALRLRAAGHRLPELLVVSSLPAPHEVDLAVVGPEKLARLVARQGRASLGRTVDQRLLDVVRERVEDDLRLWAGWRFASRPPLPLPIVTLVGEDDPIVDARRMSAWSRCTSGHFNELSVPGGHFFLEDNEDLFVDLLRALLAVAGKRRDAKTYPSTPREQHTDIEWVASA